MAGPSDFSQASWRLKLARAEEHFRDLKAEIGRYFDRNPYEARREHEGKIKRNLWRYVFRVTEQPDQRIALLIGDVVHNIRAALDHLAVALVPRRRRGSAFFPIVNGYIRIDEVSEAVLFEKPKEREDFETATRRMEADAVTIIRELQPGVTNTPALHPLAILSRLENADKHRELNRLLVALQPCMAIVTRRGQLVRRDVTMLVCDGTVVTAFPSPPKGIPADDEVKVYLSGVPKIAVNVGLKDGHAEILPLCERLVSEIPTVIFDALEPFVRRP